MQATRFKQWLARVERLTRRQREQLFALLRPAVGLDQVCATIEQARNMSACPSCDGRRLHRHGHDRGVQWAVDGRRIASAERFLRIALGASNTER